MLEWLFRLFSNKKNIKKKIQEIAHRIERFQKRYEQTKDTVKYNICKHYYNLVLNSDTIEEAKHYEEEFYKKIEEQGTDLKNYKQSKTYAEDSISEIHSYSERPSTSLDDASFIYYSTQNSQTTNENQTSTGEGEFGGAGASASWEETGSDNS